MNSRRLVLFVLLASAVWAQTFRGALNGSVADTTGAAIPGASVRLDNPATGTSRTVTTTTAGEYNFPDLPTGIYTLTVSANGFATKKVENITIAVTKTTAINVQLGIAQQQQTVEVSAAAANLDTTSSDLSAVVNDQTVQDLPINGRDFRQMIKLAPGVTTSATAPSVNGTRFSSNNYQVDGADNNDVMYGYTAQNQPGVAGIPGGLLPVDAVDQFSVETNAGADVGRNAGSNVNMVIKSGTNQFHGTAYFFNRNEDLAEPSPILKPGSRPQEIRNNQPGFSFGGPILKNKLFFFMAGEIQLAIAGESVEDTVPSAAWVTAGEAELAKYNVPVNPVSLNLLNIWQTAEPTGVFGSAPAGVNNYLANALDTYNSFNGLGKIDYHINEKHTLSIHYFGTGGTQVADVGSHLKDFFQTAPMHVHNVSVVENWIVSPQIVNQILFAVNYFSQTFQDDNIGFNAAALGLNTGSTIIGSPTMTIDGFDYVGATQPAGRTDTTGHVTDNLSYNVGKHQFRFGGEYRRAQLDVAYFNNPRGTFSFDGSRGPWANDTTLPASLAPDIESMADFLAGEPTNASGATIQRGLPEPIWQQNTADWWAQDNFQVLPQLNINFGVRYDYIGVINDSANNLANFIPGQGFVTGQQLYQKNPHDFAPRFGFSYAPKWASRFVIRGGTGLFYDVTPVAAIAFEGSSNGASNGVAYNPGGPSPVYSLTAQNVVFQPGVPVFGTAVATPPFGAFSVNPQFKTPYTLNYDLNIQTKLTNSTLLQTGYVGNFSRHLETVLDINQPINGVRPFAAEYPTLAAINQLNTNGDSNYNSLQVSLKQNLWRGFAANVNYTWSHAIDDASSYTTPMDSYNLALDRANSTFDDRHIMTGFVSYDLPQLGHFAPRLTKGWVLNALMTYTTGLPINITTGRNTDGTGENKDRVNLVPGVDPYAGYAAVSGSQSLRYLNKAAFAVPATGTYGDLGRDALYGPGFGALDFSVFKRTPITERINTELRAEIFNILNENNWRSPGTSLSSGSFGLLTQTLNGSGSPGLGFGEPRNVQLALKIIF
ncbi:MAG TPA: TonB-dependent receptor [Bryobacteraceae bacterium]|nr:TonB-dependent receptor [Bryobacteraceae bacterium]